MPYSGTGSGRDWGDSYRIRSAYGGSLTTNYAYTENQNFGSPEQIKWIKKHLNEYLSIRDYFYCDFYPLTDSIESDYSWNASQYNRPEKKDGIVQAFRHSESPFSSAYFKLRGLCPKKIYRITDLDGKGYFDAYGEELMKKGLLIETESSKCAKIYKYSAL